MTEDTLQLSLDGEDATVGCILTEALFRNGASLASCSVMHPTDAHLAVSVTAENPRECLISSCHELETQLDSMLRPIRAHMVANDIFFVEPMKNG